MANTSDVVLKNWEELKKKEKGQKSKKEVLEGVSSALPSLMRAQKLIKKSEIENDKTEIINNLRTLTDSLEGGNDGAISDIIFECARIANTYGRDLEQDIYVKNDEFCKKIYQNK